MKKINKLLIAIFGFAAFTACETTEFDELLANPNQVRPEAISLDLGVNGVQLSLAGFHSGIQAVGAEAMRMEHGFGTNWVNQFAPDTGAGAWNTAYSSILSECQLLVPLANELNAPYLEGQLRTIRGYVLMTLVDYWGDVPYSEALQGVGNFNPSVDTGESVYAVALEDLNTAKTLFTGTGNPDMPLYDDSGATDLYYGKNYTSWVQLINSLKFKYYLNTANSTELQNLLTAEAGADVNDDFMQAGNSFMFSYDTATQPDSRHPYYQGVYDDEDPGGSYTHNYMMWLMTGDNFATGNSVSPTADISDATGEKTLEDPRLRYYFYRQSNEYPTATDIPNTDESLACNDDAYPFTTAGFPFCALNNGYWGRDQGNSDGIGPDNFIKAVIGSYPAGGYTDNDDNAALGGSQQDLLGAGIQAIFMDSFIDFMRAEANERGLTTDAVGSQALLNNAITKSVNTVQGFGTLTVGTTSTAAYIAEVNTNFAANALETISKEFLLASFGCGTEAYNMYRRTGLPASLQPYTLEAGAGDFPRSLFYPINTANLNLNIPQKGDLTQQVFWDAGLPLD